MPSQSKKILIALSVCFILAALSYLYIDKQLAEYIFTHTTKSIRNKSDKFSVFLEPLIVPLYVLAALKIFEESRKIVRQLISFGSAILTTMVAVTFLKFILARPRPVLFITSGIWHMAPFHMTKNFSSMPSGHAASAGLITAVIFLFAKGGYRSLVILPIIGSLLRILSLKHYMSDVIVGFGLGYAIALLFLENEKDFVEKIKEKLWIFGKIE